jgi:hypothetical protein
VRGTLSYRAAFTTPLYTTNQCAADQVSWLLSECIRQHIERQDLGASDEPGIMGLRAARGQELDLCAPVGECVREGDTLHAIMQ